MENFNKISLTSMMSIDLTPEELTEFYNQCHGEDGRFCEGDDGPSEKQDKTAVSGRSTVDDSLLQTSRENMGLSEDEQVVLTDYIDSSTYLNNRLRHGDIDPDGRLERVYGQEGIDFHNEKTIKVDQDIETIDSIFWNKAPVTQGTTLYRGIRFEDQEEAIDTRSAWQPGELIQDGAFLSTTPDYDGAKDYTYSASGVPGIVLAITTRPDTKFLPGESSEYILNRGTALRVLDHSTDETTLLRTIYAEVI